MKPNRVALVVLLLATGASRAVSAGGSEKAAVQSIDDSAQRITLDCKGGDVFVNGSQNTITLQGTCHALKILASGNTIVVDTVEAIEFMGGQNKVTWKTAFQGKPPSVSDLGSDNSVEQAKPSP